MRVLSVVLAGTLVLLAACGDESSQTGEPSQAEMQDVVGANIKSLVDKSSAAARAYAARTGKPQPAGFQGFSSFRKGECAAVTEPKAGWTCTFSMTFKVNDKEMSKDHSGFFARNEQGQLVFTPSAR